MSELGRLLSEARAAKQLSLADVEAVTRIRQKYIQALENGQYDKLPRGTIARGFLRTYATFLGLDVEAVLASYTGESGDTGPDVPIAEPGKPRLVDYRPLEVELSDTVRAPRWLPWLAGFVIVAALAATGWWALSRNPGWNPLIAFGPARAATATPSPTATRWVVTATPVPTAVATLPTPTSDLLTLPTPTVPPSPTLTPRPTATPEIVAQIALDLRTTQRAWVRITIDGAVIEEGSLEAGVTRSWEATSVITVRTGNAGGISLTLNGADLGPMGPVGQVSERTWVVDQEGVIETTGITPAPGLTPDPTLTPTPAG